MGNIIKNFKNLNFPRKRFPGKFNIYVMHTFSKLSTKKKMRMKISFLLTNFPENIIFIGKVVYFYRV